MQSGPSASPRAKHSGASVGVTDASIRHQRHAHGTATPPAAASASASGVASGGVVVGGMGLHYAPSSSPSRVPHHTHISLRNAFCQTEASMHYSDSVEPNDDELHRTHCAEFEQLKRLRDVVKQDLSSLGATVYDLLGIKDIVLKLSEQLPDAPVQDILIVSSRLFRATSQVARGVGAFFRIVFSDDFVDDDFHFSEARHLRKSLREFQKKLEAVTNERDTLRRENAYLQEMVNRHDIVVTNLSERNDDLEKRHHSLEDNMAILFQQITRDFISLDETAYRQVESDLQVQAQLGAARSQFLQSIDAVQSRLKFFSTLLKEMDAEIQGSNAPNDPNNATKSKLKALDVHASQILSRFGAVREGLQDTAAQLSAALSEKKKIIALSLQHLQAYDTLNRRMRSARTLLHDLRQAINEAERSVSVTFAPGTTMKVDKTGEISSLDNVNSGGGGSGGGGGGTLAVASSAVGVKSGTGMTKPGANVSNIVSILHLLHRAQDAAATLTTAVNTDEEHRALLRAVSSTVPQSLPEHTTGPGGATLPTSSATGGGGATSSGAISGLADDAATREESAMEERLADLRADFAVKVNFLREVYEERIEDLEAKVERLQRKAMTSATTAATGVNPQQQGGVGVGGSTLLLGNTFIASSPLVDAVGAPVTFSAPSILLERSPAGGGAPSSSNANSAGGSAPTPIDPKDAALQAHSNWADVKDRIGDTERDNANAAVVRLSQLEAAAQEGALVDGGHQHHASRRSSLSSPRSGALIQPGGGGVKPPPHVFSKRYVSHLVFTARLAREDQQQQHQQTASAANVVRYAGPAPPSRQTPLGGGFRPPSTTASSPWRRL